MLFYGDRLFFLDFLGENSSDSFWLLQLKASKGLAQKVSDLKTGRSGNLDILFEVGVQKDSVRGFHGVAEGNVEQSVEDGSRSGGFEVGYSKTAGVVSKEGSEIAHNFG